MGECVQRYAKTVIGDDRKLIQMKKSPFFKMGNMLEMENGEHEVVEITMTPKTVYDHKPVPMAAAILSNSKLHFIKFIYEVVYKFFRPGSFKLCYCDTDSIAIGTFLINNAHKKHVIIYLKPSQEQKNQWTARVEQICFQYWFR